MERPFLLSPSILSCDFSRMGDALAQVEAAGGDMVHIDVMDGHFVPEITIGAAVVSALRKRSALPFDVHLMVEDPEHFVGQFDRAGADLLTFHYEAAVHAHSLSHQIRSLGMKAGISIVPSTPASHLSEMLPFVDLVLVMTVNPGYGGQKMLDFCLDKVRQLAEIREERGLNFLISVDGGVNGKNFNEVLASGVDIAVSGSAFFAGDLEDTLKGRQSASSSSLPRGNLLRRVK